MLYLIDANVLMTAHHLYYPIDAVPEYWDWLAHVGSQGRVKIPREIFNEVLDGGDDDQVYAWLHQPHVTSALFLEEEANLEQVQRVLATGYGIDLSDSDLVVIGKDPFLIACAMAGQRRSVVTCEVSKPTLQRQNRRIPDVCRDMGVMCCDPFQMNRALGFRTNWRT